MRSNHADLILTGGKVLTLDAKDTIAEAVAIKDGRFICIGASAEIEGLAGSLTERIDLGGKVLIPGFVDAHTHVDLYGMMTSDFVVDCRIPSLESVDDILDRIREKAAETPEGEVILGQGRVVQPYPTRAQLDAVAPKHPVIIKSTMHNYYLNSCALRKFGIDRDHPTARELFEVVPGAVIERDLKTGEPTGRVDEAWNYMFPRSRSPLPYELTYASLKKGLQTLTEFGVTSVAEFLDFAESARIYQEMHKNGELNVRLQLIPCFHGLHKTVELDEVVNVGLTSGFGNEWVKFGGLKIFVDLQQHTTCASIQLKDWFSKAHRSGIRMYMHCTTRKGQDMALDVIEAEAEETGLDRVRQMRHRIEHMGNECHDENHLHRLKKVGVIGLPTAYLMNIGPYKLFSAKTDRKYLFRTMLDMGLCVPGNSDGAGAIPECFNPMYQIWCMVTRPSWDGQRVSPSERISVKEALKVYTSHSAYAGLEEDIKGTIEEGKLADCVVLSDNPMEVPEDRLKEIVVDLTIVGGKVVYRR